MYINNSKLTTTKIINGFIIAVCGVPAIINVLLLILMTTADDPVFTPVIRLIFNAFFIISLLIQIGIIIWRVLFLQNLSRCGLYNSIFEEDHDGIITRSVYPEVPPRVEYAMSELGESMRPIIDAMAAFGIRYKEWSRKNTEGKA